MDLLQEQIVYEISWKHRADHNMLTEVAEKNEPWKRVTAKDNAPRHRRGPRRVGRQARAEEAVE